MDFSDKLISNAIKWSVRRRTGIIYSWLKLIKFFVTKASSESFFMACVFHFISFMWIPEGYSPEFELMWAMYGWKLYLCTGTALWLPITNKRSHFTCLSACNSASQIKLHLLWHFRQCCVACITGHTHTPFIPAHTLSLKFLIGLNMLVFGLPEPNASILLTFY